MAGLQIIEVQMGFEIRVGDKWRWEKLEGQENLRSYAGIAFSFCQNIEQVLCVTLQKNN